MILVFDTETTGVSGKPYIVQLAAILAENDGTLRGSCNLIIKPDGYEIPEDASRIHGITTDIAKRVGVPLAVAISLFNNMLLACQDGLLIAHNLQFDIRMVKHAYERGSWPSRIEGPRHFCTMEHTKNRVRLPPTAKQRQYGYNDFKAPKLAEAYEFAFGKPMENAHDALYDVLACKDLYFWIKNQELRGLEQEPAMLNPAQ